MPTYEYKCKSCGELSEAFQSMTAAPLRKCPRCGKNALERQIGTGAAVVFKGSGFYQTDYRSESYKKAAEAESKPASTESKPAGTSESKPAAESPGPKKADAPTTESKPKAEAAPTATTKKPGKKPKD